jgi:hypothetical protein
MHKTKFLLSFLGLAIVLNVASQAYANPNELDDQSTWTNNAKTAKDLPKTIVIKTNAANNGDVQVLVNNSILKPTDKIAAKKFKAVPQDKVTTVAQNTNSELEGGDSVDSWFFGVYWNTSYYVPYYYSSYAYYYTYYPTTYYYGGYNYSYYYSNCWW